MSSSPNDVSNARAAPTVRRHQPRRRRWLWGIVLFVGVWFIGDFGYSLYVKSAIARWESSINWTKDGLAPDANEFEVGQGTVGILMVHGFSDSPQIYRKLAPALGERGFACRAILLPGFGRNVDAYANTSVDAWLRKVNDEITLLRQHHETIYIVAHSLGGAITINHVLSHPQHVDGIVLMAPAVEVSNQRSPIFPTRFWHEFSKFALPSTSITISPFDMDAHDPSERDREDRNRFSPRRVVDNTFQLLDANRGRAGEFTIPTLVFLSTSDMVVDSNAIERFYDQCGSKSKRLIKLENSGHMIPVDHDWQTVVEQIDAFIKMQP